MSKYHHGNAALTRARKAREKVRLPAQCWRCGNVIDIGQPFDMGHRVDVALGGHDSELAPEHRRCNRRTGGRLGGQIKAARARKAVPPSW